MSPMLSALAAMPATRQGTFRGAFTPHGPPTLRCSLTSAARPQRCARAITGTRPARDTRFGSSNDACVRAGSCDNRTCEVSSPARRRKLQQLPSSQLRGHLSRWRARMHTQLLGGSRLSRPSRKHGQVRFDAPVGRRRYRSRNPPVSISCTSAPQNDAFCAPQFTDAEISKSVPNGGYFAVSPSKPGTGHDVG
jgi:hypothetical protein